MNKETVNLKEVLIGIAGLKAKGNLDIDITSVEDDYRQVKDGSMFVAIKGFEHDGHNFIDKAIENGAKVIMFEEGEDYKRFKTNKDTTLIMAPDTRKALAKCECNFYGNPSKKFKLIGITGTKGKTTTSFMIKAILEKAGKKVGLIGTIANYIGDEIIEESSITTPDSVKLQKIFAQMVEEKVDVVVMEVSSQSLKLDRVEGTDFDIGIFTNFSQDHISPKEHPNMKDYFEKKLKLFNMCKYGIVNADDLYTAKIPDLIKDYPIETFGIDNNCNFSAKDLTVTNTYADFKAKIKDRNERIKVSIPGRFSVYNALAAICATRMLGASPEDIKEALKSIKVPGRSEMVDNKKNIPIMIDYAHSPESLESILKTLSTYTIGRVICVFGCGGDRDTSKRPVMGEIAGRLADYTIITSDNPRTEDPEEIINQIEQGIKKTKAKYECITNRKEAIKKAIMIASKNDIVLLAGKGHEKYQEINKVKNPFDERQIVKEVVNEIQKKEKNKK